MTSCALILGVVPLVLATGAGAASRWSLGTAVFGGMTVATLLGVLIIPVLFVVVERVMAIGRRPKEPTPAPQSETAMDRS